MWFTFCLSFPHACSEYAAIVWAALELEDTMKNAASGKANDYKFVSTIRPSRTGKFADLVNRAG